MTKTWVEQCSSYRGIQADPTWQLVLPELGQPTCFAIHYIPRHLHDFATCLFHEAMVVPFIEY